MLGLVSRILLLLWSVDRTFCFMPPRLPSTEMLHCRALCPHSHKATSVLLQAKKKKKGTSGAGGQGFGKTTPGSSEVDDDDSDTTSESASSTTATSIATQPSTENSPVILESLTIKPSSSSSSRGVAENIVPVDVRTQKILRDKYGLKPLSEQQADLNKPVLSKRVDDGVNVSQRPQEEEFDIMTKLPAPVLLAIDRFLKVGATISAILFVAAGLGITWEAWSVTSHTPLPEDVDRFIVDVVEPNFTKGLFVLLGFSVSLGLFASAQFGSQSSQYRED